jgi:carbonic anhydrase
LPKTAPLSGADLFASYEKITTDITVQNNGHAIAADLSNRGFGGLTLDDCEFALQSITFHARSEHSIEGKRYPVEVHLMHKRYDGDARAIVAFLVESRMSPRPQLEKVPGSGDAPPDAQLGIFDGAMPAVMNVSTASPTELRPLDLNAWYTGAFYKYEGSLTAPPCSENVVWFVRQKPILASNAQVKGIFDTIFEMTHDLGNARAVLPVMGRAVSLVNAVKEEPVLELDTQKVPWHGATRPFQGELEAEEAKEAVAESRRKLQDLDSRVKAAAAAEARAFDGFAPHP